jgi:23S rRNA G2445 N2-methylase RlmL
MATPVYRFEAEVAEGLEPIAREEIVECLDEHGKLRPPAPGQRPGAIRFDFTGRDLRGILALRTVHSVYLVQRFPIPRPKALLGDQHFRALLEMIELARRLWPAGTHKTLALDAAGSESSVMRRIRDELAAKTGLEAKQDEADLLIRLRHPPNDEAWEALVRMSPRPLATRTWRVCNREGALNATVAHAMVLLTEPKPDDVVLNLMCGSGTLLIERLSAGPVSQAIGYDHDETALDCARQNVEASGHGEFINLRQGDVRELPMADTSVDALLADLPFGHLSGSHEGNVEMYPAILREAGRVAKPGAKFVLITHEVRLMESLLAESDTWTAQQVIRVALGGLYPRIFVLQRT